VIYNSIQGQRSSGKSENTAIDQQTSIAESGETDINTPDINIISVDEAYRAYTGSDDYLFLDVRTVSEYEDGHIEGALSIPLSEIPDRLSELPVDRPIIVYCNGSGCDRSRAAAEVLMNNGFIEVYDLAGTGIIEWIEKGYPNSQVSSQLNE
jgi:rhodanese-related sulfurtransferase